MKTGRRIMYRNIIFLSIYLSVCLSVCLSISCSSHLEHRASVKRFVSLQFLNFRQSVGLLGRGISPKQSRYLHRITRTQNKRTQTSMPWMGFEPKIPALERAKTVRTFDHSPTLIGNICLPIKIWNFSYRWIFILSSSALWHVAVGQVDTDTSVGRTAFIFSMK
jgi:hypothetical protein